MVLRSLRQAHNFVLSNRMSTICFDLMAVIEKLHTDLAVITILFVLRFFCIKEHDMK